MIYTIIVVSVREDGRRLRHSWMFSFIEGVNKLNNNCLNILIKYLKKDSVIENISNF